ncbi:MAG: hypothetical protein ACREFX_05050 [Opitutaceae bacterium]
MKKWMYVIFPGLGLVIFLIFYVSFSKEQAALQLRRDKEVAAQQARADAKKRAAEEKATAEALRREQQQQQDLARQKAASEKKWNDDTAAIRADIAKYSGEADAFAKKASNLDIELDALNRERDQESRKDFDLLKAVEQANVEQRDAELQIQRMVAMIAQRADQSVLTGGNNALAQPLPSS